jgi:ribosomal protein S18 acetylase RimI-like enzyme
MIRPGIKIAFPFILVGILCQWFLTEQAQAFAVGSISADSMFFPSPLERFEQAQQTVPIAFRIRSTVESDVHTIADVWARCINEPHKELVPTNPNGFNFRRRMNFLKSKDNIQQLLFSRLKAIRAGEKIMKECSQRFQEDSLSESQRMRFLWSNDRFRMCLERAAKLSSDPHTWNQHHFACTPESTESLQHKMLTAEDKYSGELLGFCEIAMLSTPFEGGDRDGTRDTVRPALVNLVVHPKFRRRGVASRIVQSAQRYVAKEWASDNLNLYVNHDNVAAISLYRRLGFQKTATSQLSEAEVAQCYMSMSLRSGNTSQRHEFVPGGNVRVLCSK